MKKIFFSILASLLIVSTAFARDIGESYKFIYTIVDGSGTHVTGQTPTLKIQKSSNGYWYDFNDSNFKNSGWTTKAIALTEDATNGMYYRTFTPPATETTAEVYIFVVDNTDLVYADHGSLAIEYQDYIPEIKKARGR